MKDDAVAKFIAAILVSLVLASSMVEILLATNRRLDALEKRIEDIEWKAQRQSTQDARVPHSRPAQE